MKTKKKQLIVLTKKKPFPKKKSCRFGNLRLFYIYCIITKILKNITNKLNFYSRINLKNFLGLQKNLIVYI